MLIPKNPATMIGTIDRCWLFAYRCPVEEVKAYLPPMFEPVTHKGFGFWNVVVSHIDSMRPSIMPKFFGISYWHAAYRIYVRFHPKNSAPIEGLYFLRSDCDNEIMSMMGNNVTDFNFHTSPIKVDEQTEITQIEIHSKDARALVILDQSKPATLPPGSIFDSIDEAKAFLKYKPNGISVAGSGANIVHITRNEDEWRSKLVSVQGAQWDYFKGKNVSFEICYQVEPIFYRWNKGRIYQSAGAN
jgi:hypothetical protein